MTAGGLPAAGQMALYRHAYADAYQLQAYRQARWSRPVETLLAQQLARRLQAGRPVLTPDQAGIRGRDSERQPAVLVVDLERFERVFGDPDRSSGVVRLQATLPMPRGSCPPAATDCWPSAGSSAPWPRPAPMRPAAPRRSRRQAGPWPTIWMRGCDRWGVEGNMASSSRYK
ncbi:MAG: ABC-type transport auxiliary lipoprotein family protein [Burkholderiaceae bacterium]